MRQIFVLVLLFPLFLQAETLTIFAASDLKFALDKIVNAFEQAHPTDKIKMIYGSSGKGMVQIERGAPFDLYFSANMDYVQKLYKKGDIVTEPKLYAIGRLVLWSKNTHFDPKKGFDQLREPWVKHIAIANPAHAPYGEKAKEALINAKIYDAISSKIILGENISQTANFVATQAADIGVIALSLVKAPTIAQSKYGAYFLIDAKLHEPLRQGYGITKVGADKPLAKKFFDYFQTPEVQAVMQKYGFKVEQ